MKLTYESSLAHFLEAFAASKQYSEEAAAYIPGSYSRRTFNFGPHAVYVDRAEGAYLYTVDGRKLLDFNNNYTVSVLGYQNEAVDRAIWNAMKKGYSLGNPTVEESNLAKMLTERVASMEQVKFSCSASESCLSAVRIARAYTGKKKIAKMEGGYHGFIDELAFSAHPNPAASAKDLTALKPQAESAGILDDIAENIVLLTQNNIEASEQVLRAHADEIACVIMELQSGSGGIVVLEPDYVKKMRELTKELGIVLIFDETISIRADRGGLQNVYQVKPDLTVTGKSVGGGLPLGVVGGSKEVMSVVTRDEVKISGTHHGHRLACAAGIATLRQMDEHNLYEYLNALADRIKNELNAWAEERNYAFHVFGCHSVIAYAFTKEPGQRIQTHRDYWRYTDAEKMQTFALEAAVRGYFPVHRGELSMNAAMTPEDITRFIADVKEIIVEMMA